MPANQFSNQVGFIPSGVSDTQNLGLTCDPGANINVTMYGTNDPDAGNSSVLALTGKGTAGVASGVGVQLLYNNIPLPVNSEIRLKTGTSSAESLPLVARYYQTKTAVSAGTANTSATLSITYQ